MPPDQTGLEALVFWRADVLARVVHLVPAEAPSASLVRFTPELWGGRQLGRATPDGYHLIVAPLPGFAFHLLLPGTGPPPQGMPLAPVVAFDPWHPERAAAALAFWRSAQAPRVSQAAATPTPSRRALESAFLLWALDQKRAGASDRAIAEAIYGMPPPAWSDTAERGRLRRLLASARRLTASAYRRLLKPRRGGFGP